MPTYDQLKNWGVYLVNREVVLCKRLFYKAGIDYVSYAAIQGLTKESKFKGDRGEKHDPSVVDYFLTYLGVTSPKLETMRIGGTCSYHGKTMMVEDVSCRKIEDGSFEVLVTLKYPNEETQLICDLHVLLTEGIQFFDESAQ